MRMLILSLLALGAHANAIGHRLNLQAYSPARGEFPVQSELAQGYLRYQDNTGAERLVGFNYPEPLYGVRTDDNYGNQYANQYTIKNDHTLAEFRAWCEQRYNALRHQLNNLQAIAKRPSENLLSQYEPLEQIIQSNAFDPVPGLSPELQAIRDEQFRIWKEQNRQVLPAKPIQQQVSAYKPFQQKTSEVQTKIAQPAKTNPVQQIFQVKKTQPQQIQPAQSYEPLQAPQPIQETAEVLRAREEHLKLYNEALQAQLKADQSLPAPVPAQSAPTPAAAAAPAPAQQLPALPSPAQSQPQAQLFKATPSASIPLQQAPQPVEDTPEVKLAREQHLKEYNEAILRQSTEYQTNPVIPLPTAASAIFKTESQPQSLKKIEAIAPLPAATIKSSIPTASQPPLPTPATQEQKIEQLTQNKLAAEDKVADIEDRIRFEEQEIAAERLREEELRRQERKQAELEQQREQLRLKEEREALEAERLALQLQEQQRIQQERLEETKILKGDQQIIFNTPAQPSTSYKIISPTPTKPEAGQALAVTQPQPQAIAQQQQVQNGFFLRIQSGQPSAEPIAEGFVLAAEHTQNPFLLRYVQQPSQAYVKSTSGTSSSVSGSSSTSSSVTGFTSSSTGTPSKTASPAAITTGLRELEQATREHFKAHEVALEQLRLANMQNPTTNVQPCQH